MELEIEFSASSSKAKLKEVLNAVCAILNSFEDGGTLILFSESQPYSQKDADDITRKIEQTLIKTFGVESTTEMFDKISPTDGEENVNLRYQIKPTIKLPTTLYTINYNLFCTSIAQVLQRPSDEPIENVVNFVKGENKQKNEAVLGKHTREFSFGAKVALEESKGIQLKQLKDGDSASLAMRMTNESNKLALYVSAFANGRGGHIYYGIQIDDNGSYVVHGQTVQDIIDKDTIISKVKETIDKLFVWPDNKERLNKGHDWDIYFEKVSNTTDPKYVIVISVNSHERGVFLKEPESYHIVDGKVEKMKFLEWVERFLLADYKNIFPREKFPRSIGRGTWSSPEALEKHVDVLAKFVLLRNDGQGAKFLEYKEQMSASSDEYTKCLIQQQEAGNFFRQRLLDEAESKLKENEYFLNEATAEFKDVGIYRVRMLYWMGVVKRAQGDYKRCQVLCNDALQAAHHQPNILVVPWVHYNKAKVLEIDIAKQKDSKKERELRMICMRFYESALRSSIALSGYPENLVVDLQQRVLISMARLSLGAFFDGEKVIHKVCSRHDLKHADYLLGVVKASVDQQGLSMTKLSKSEYQLICAERCYRSWEEFSKPEFLKKALKRSKKALKTADQKHFRDVSEFAQGQIQVLKAILAKPPDE